MLKHKGGHKVGKGTYWNVSSGHRLDVLNQEILPGDNESTYLKLPSIIMLLLGPVIGLLYVISLPFIAIGAVITLLGKKVLEGSLSLVGKTISFGWRPTMAYLAGRKRKSGKPQKTDDTPTGD